MASLERTQARLTRVRAELLDQRREADAALADADERLASMESLLRSRRAVLERAQGDPRPGSWPGRPPREAAGGPPRARRRDRRGRAAGRGDRAGAGAGAGGPRAGRPGRPGTVDEPGAVRARRPLAGVPGAPGQAVLDRIAQCESGGDPRAVSASGQYRGKYQFDQGTWEGLGGTGDPAAAPEAEQDRRAAMLYAQSGPAPWPVCGYR